MAPRGAPVLLSNITSQLFLPFVPAAEAKPGTFCGVSSAKSSGRENSIGFLFCSISSRWVDGAGLSLGDSATFGYLLVQT